MRLLPCCRKPHEDELLYGYMRSLAQMNGIDSMKDMIKFVCGDSGIANIHSFFPTGLSRLCREFSVNRTFPSIDEAVTMTTYYADTYGVNEGAAQKMSEILLYPESVVLHQPKIEEHHIRICPECWQSDKERTGAGYLHLSHHFKGVTVCAEHKIPLMYMEMEKVNDRFRDLNSVEWNTYKVEDMDTALKRAARQVLHHALIAQSGMLRKQECPQCGSVFLSHPRSIDSGAGCPFCAEIKDPIEWLDGRLRLVTGGEYALARGNKTGSRFRAVHLACGNTAKFADSVLYMDGWKTSCSTCISLFPDALYRRFDPERKHWIFHENTIEDRERKKIHVTHLDCGFDGEVFMTSFRQLQGGRCPECHSKVFERPVETMDPSYHLIGYYSNNRRTATFLHDDCGTLFRTSKTSFLAGTRCPLCVPRFDFSAVKDAVLESLPGWDVTPSEKRGYLIVTLPDGQKWGTMQNRNIVLDLMSEEPYYFTMRRKRLEPGRSIRKMIYDSIKSAEEEKGFWTFLDGIIKPDGTREITDMDMPGGISRDRRNLVQDLCKAGYLIRIEEGKYRTSTLQEQAESFGINTCEELPTDIYKK